MTTGRHEQRVSLVPSRKVGSGALGGAVATIALWLIGLTNVDVPQGVAAAITAVVVSGIAYLVPNAS